MIEAYFKPVYQTIFLNTFLKIPSTKKLTPNTVTVISMLSGLAVLPALFWQHAILATVLLLLSGYCDSLDGALARATQQTSDVGTVLDIMADRIVECVVILGLCMINPAARGLACALMLASMVICITSFLVVGIFTPNNSEKSFHYSPGLMERPEAFAFFLAMIWLPKYFLALSSLFSVLVLYTGLNRIREFIKLQI